MRKMKDSGIEWIGEIPEGWEVRRIKYCADSPVVKVGESNTTLKYIGLENIVSGNGRFIDTDSEYDKSQALLFQANDILWGKLRPYLAKVFHAIEEGCCSSEFCILRINNNYSARYFWNLLISPGFVDTVNQSTYGSKMPRANESYIRGIYIPLPPLSEQERIAGYLDEKCGRIDAAIEKQKQVIEKLQEYKRSLITQTVTKGLNPKAKMKDSGIEWIGEIPEGWEVNKINRLFYSIGSGTTPKDEEDFIGDIHWIQSGDINGGILDCSEKKVNQNTINKYTALKIFKAPYIIVAMYGASVGNVSISTINGCVNQACCVLSNPVQVLQYSFYAILALKPYLIWKAIGGGQPNISQAVVKQLRIPNPPLSEQQQIADYLDDKCSKIDAVIAQKQALIEKLTEYKKSLIYETVTGKREI